MMAMLLTVSGISLTMDQVSICSLFFLFSLMAVKDILPSCVVLCSGMFFEITSMKLTRQLLTMLRVLAYCGFLLISTIEML